MLMTAYALALAVGTAAPSDITLGVMMQQPAVTAESVPGTRTLLYPPRYFRFWGNYTQEFLLDDGVEQRVVEYQIGQGDVVYGQGGWVFASDWTVPIYNEFDDLVYCATMKTVGIAAPVPVLVALDPRTMTVVRELELVGFPTGPYDVGGDLVWTLNGGGEARLNTDLTSTIFADPSYALSTYPNVPVNGQSAAAPGRRFLYVDWSGWPTLAFRIATITGPSTYTLSAAIPAPAGYGLGSAQSAPYIRAYGSVGDTFFNYGGDSSDNQAGVIVNMTSGSAIGVTDPDGPGIGIKTYRSRYDETSDAYTVFATDNAGDWSTIWTNGPMAINAATGVVIGRYGAGFVVGGSDYDNSYTGEPDALGDGRLVVNNDGGNALGVWNILEPGADPFAKLTSTTMSSPNVGSWYLGSTISGVDHVVAKARYVETPAVAVESEPAKRISLGVKLNPPIVP